MEKLTLETDYTKNGNSSGTPLDTLAIAVTGGDYNSIEEYNWDYLAETEYQAKKDWIDSRECEEYFQKTLAKDQAKAYADDLPAYDEALEEYRNNNFGDVRAGDYDPKDEAQKALAEKMEKALTWAQEGLWKDWLHGDYSGNFNGVLPSARKEWGIDFEEEKGEVYADITLEFIEELKEGGNIERKSKKAAREWLEMEINYMAAGKYREEQRKREARRAENEKTRAYKEKCRIAEEEAKKAHLLALSK